MIEKKLWSDVHINNTHSNKHKEILLLGGYDAIKGNNLIAYTMSLTISSKLSTQEHVMTFSEFLNSK